MALQDMLTQKAVTASIWSALLAIEEQVVHLVPVGIEHGGNLRNSITIATKDNYKQHGPTEPKENPQPLKAPTQFNFGIIGTAVVYAWAVEFGRPDLPNYPMQPYLRPGFDMVRAKAGMLCAETLKRHLAEYANRYPHRTVI